MLIYLSMIDSDTDKSKFEMLYNEYRNLMYYTANRILNNSYDAEDAVHQAFLKVIENLDKIEEPKCPKTRSFLVIITERKALDLYRTKMRRTVVSVDDENMDIPADSEIDSFAERSVFASAIAALPVKYRQLILLKYDNGFSEHKIGQILSMTDANVKKTIQCAKAKLQVILEEMEV